jgi:hypothetical protein
VRVLNNGGVGYTSWVVAGIDWVTAHASEIEVANMSLSGEGKSLPEEEAIAKGLNAGVVYAVAAGNESKNAAGFAPANDPDVITVSALTDTDGKPGGLGGECNERGSDDTLATFSNWGAGVDIAAPGTCIYSTYKEGKYATQSGTSMASPHVAGAAAVWASKSNPNSKEDVEKIRQSLLDEASLAWKDTSEDSTVERLLYLGGKALSGVEVQTGGYSAIEEGKATLHGSVNLRGAEAEWQFEYGTTTEYGQKAPTSMKKLSAGTKYTTVSEAISGLKPEQAYHYRLVLKSASGTIYGTDRTFVPPLGGMETPTSGLKNTSEEWLGDIDCASSSFCMAVGMAYDAEAKEQKGLSFRLKEGNWVYTQLPIPANGSSVRGSGVDCISSSYCTAVGQYYDKGEAGWMGYAASWNGSSWTVQSVPKAAGAGTTRIHDVSCRSASECIAVGVYLDIASDKWANYSARWKNSAWGVLTTPNPYPETSVEARLTHVSCVSATFCEAVGRTYVLEGPPHQEQLCICNRPSLFNWNGSEWTVQTAASNKERRNDVSCVSTSFCLAVGPGPPNTETWDGTKWSNAGLPGFPGVSLRWLSGVSCTSSSFCGA